MALDPLRSFRRDRSPLVPAHPADRSGPRGLERFRLYAPLSPSGRDHRSDAKPECAPDRRTALAALGDPLPGTLLAPGRGNRQSPLPSWLRPPRRGQRGSHAQVAALSDRLALGPRGVGSGAGGILRSALVPLPARAPGGLARPVPPLIWFGAPVALPRLREHACLPFRRARAVRGRAVSGGPPLRLFVHFSAAAPLAGQILIGGSRGGA